ncbi:MAG: flavohemoglobin expression-modulating QEGLA motif protein [Pseudoxanthomonas sp.]
MAAVDIGDWQRWDSQIVAVGSRIRLLKALNWPVHVEQEFLSGWARRAARLPVVPAVRCELRSEKDTLGSIMQAVDRAHPLGNWLYKTAWSYRVAALMLENAGTAEFVRFSSMLYGRPDYRYRSQDMTSFDGASEMLSITDGLPAREQLKPELPTMTAEAFADRLRVRIEPVFGAGVIRIVLDPNLSSKAAAGGSRIVLRATALFTERDLDQLTEHEAFTHSLTSLNGKQQPLRVLGLGSPRTTRTQEGLAIFAEIMTGSLDLSRLRRIALRVVMLKRALDGADFIEVFHGFLDAGQSEVESYRSAMRLFRGGDVRGRVCFTKDGTYLEGAMAVYAFVGKALKEGRADLMAMLFAGRITLADAVMLAPYRGTAITAPRYLPPWTRDPQRILSTMAFFTAIQRLRHDRMTLDRFAEFEDEVIAENPL